MLVRRAYLDHRNVTSESPAAVQLLGLAQEYRDVVGISGLDALADVPAYEESLVEEYSVELRIGVRSRTFRVEMVDADILKLTGFSSSAEGFDKDARRTCHTAQMDMVA